MSTRKGGLGRGLAALIPTAPASGQDPRLDSDAAPPAAMAPTPAAAATGAPQSLDDPGGAAPDSFGADAVYREISVEDIRPNPRQPRQVFEPEALAELVASLREVGMLQPVVVRPAPAGSVEAAGGTVAARYELVMGERRWRAAQQAGLTHVPAIVRGTANDAMLRDALLENLHRAQLNPLEEAAAYQQLLGEFGATHEELAARIGRSRSQVSNTIRLLGLPPAVQRRVAAGVLSAGHARALLGLPDPADADALAHRIVAEGLSVRTVEELVALAGRGERPARAARPRSPAATDPQAVELAGRVADRLETRVHAELGRRRGRLVIEVADVADLARVVDLITSQNKSITID